MAEFERNDLYDEKLNNVEKDVKVLYKKVGGLENTKEILVKLSLMYEQTSEAICEIKKSNERLTGIVQEQSITLTKVGNSLDSMKTEVDGTKEDLRDLSNKIDEKTNKKDSFKEFVYKLGIKMIEWAIIGGLAYYFIDKF